MKSNQYFYKKLMRKGEKLKQTKIQKELGNINTLWIITVFLISLAHLWNIQIYPNIDLKSNIHEYKNQVNWDNPQEKIYNINIDWKDYILKIQPASSDLGSKF